MIDIKATVEKILSIKGIGFKVHKEYLETGMTILTTPVDDSFSRGVITIECEQISLAIQSVDENEKLVKLFQPLPIDLLESIVLNVEKEVEEDGKSNT